MRTLRKGAVSEAPRKDPVQEGCFLEQGEASCQRLLRGYNASARAEGAPSEVRQGVHYCSGELQGRGLLWWGGKRRQVCEASIDAL